MNNIFDILVKKISLSGPISISDYMNICLMHPKHGYYSKKDPFGTNGDFVTSPEISQVFGELIGLCLAQNWLDQDRPPFALVEAGPGRGTLIDDVLRVTKSVPGFHDVMTIHLVEKSKTLRKIQKEKLSTYNVRWHESFTSLPEKPIFLVANEFFDALPIKQFRKTQHGWEEILIGIKGNKLSFFLGNKIPLTAIPNRLENTKFGEVIEICSEAKPIIGELSKRIKKYGGCAIIIDYGDQNLVGNTFQAVKNHQKVNPLDHPGDCDLTAHVNFGDLLTYASDVFVTKTTSQGLLLNRLGISKRFEKLMMKLSDSKKAELKITEKRLTDPSEMGELFKAIAIVPSKSVLPAGFNS